MDPVPWVYAIGRRTCIDELRRRAGSRVRLLPGSEAILLEAEATPWGTPSFAATEEAYSDAERCAVLEALDELPPRQRAALALTKIQGLTVIDAARTLGTSESAVKLRAHRAYARLRELLGRDELFHDRLEASSARHQRARENRASSART
jgi:RNA polymerase sigma-70 factor (ECF subfamily)